MVLKQFTLEVNTMVSSQMIAFFDEHSSFEVEQRDLLVMIHDQLLGLYTDSVVTLHLTRYKPCLISYL